MEDIENKKRKNKKKAKKIIRIYFLIMSAVLFFIGLCSSWEIFDLKSRMGDLERVIAKESEKIKEVKDSEQSKETEVVQTPEPTEIPDEILSQEEIDVSAPVGNDRERYEMIENYLHIYRSLKDDQQELRSFIRNEVYQTQINASENINSMYFRDNDYNEEGALDCVKAWSAFIERYPSDPKINNHIHTYAEAAKRDYLNQMSDEIIEQIDEIIAKSKENQRLWQ